MLKIRILIEIDALDSSHNPVTLRFSSAPAFTNYTGANGPWSPCIVDPGLMQTDLFANGKTTGASTYSFGEVILSNMKVITDLSGPHDDLKNYDFYGAPVRMFTGPLTGVFPADFTRAYTAAVQSMNDLGGNQISFTLRGRQAELDVPYALEIPGDAFLGTCTGAETSGADAVEGVESQKDAKKPVLLGRAHNFPLVSVNPYRLIYAVASMGGIATTEMGADLHVYDNGVELSFYGEMSLADMTAPLSDGIVSPPAGTYCAAPEGFVKLGASPAGTITCSAANAGLALTSHPKNLITAMLTAKGFSAMIDSGTFAGYTDKEERGVYLSSPTNISGIIDQLVSPLGYWYFNHDGMLRFGQMSDPAGKTAVYTLDSTVNISSLVINKSKDTTGGVPAKKVTFNYDQNYTVIAQPAGSVSDLTIPSKTWLSEQWRQDSVLADFEYPFSEEMIIDTALTSKYADGLSAMHDLHTVNRELVDVGIVVSEFLPASVLLPGQVVSLNLHGRFGYTDKRMVIVGIVINYVEESVKLTLWG